VQRVLVAIFVAGCGPAAPHQTIEKPIGNHAAPVAAVRTCALGSPRRTPVAMGLRKYLGRIGDRSWVLAEDRDHVALLTLDDAGALAKSELPIGGDRISTPAIDGNDLWIDSDEQGLGTDDQVLFHVELHGATATVGAPERLRGSPLAGASSFAVGPHRALFFTFAAHQGFGLWDRDHHVAVGALVPLATAELDPPDMRCVADRCFAVAIPGDGPTRRLTVFRFDPATGAADSEALAADHLASHLVIPSGERTIVVWTSFSRSGMFARVLDATARPIGPEVMLANDGRDPQLVDRETARFAFRDDQGWQIAQLAPDASHFASTARIGFENILFVESARTADGVLSAAISSSTEYDGGIHAWHASTDARFVRDDGTVEPVINVMRKAGGGMGGFAGVPLATPTHAAVISLPGDRDDGPGELTLLREPCTR
jgi:hypothetical protein